MSEKLTTEQINALSQIDGGADVLSYSLATTLRDVEKTHPELLTIGDYQGDYDPVGRLPYFGAILTDVGKAAIQVAAGGES